MKEMIERIGSEDLAATETLRARTRLVRKALALGISLVLLAALCIVVASHIGFEHMACRMAEDALGSALSHSRGLVKRVQESAARRDRNVEGAVRENAKWLRGELRALVDGDPAILYGMILSQGSDIVVHTREELEGTKVNQEGETSPLSTSVREFPGGRLGYGEFIYEVRIPLDVDGEGGHEFVLALSKERIDQHIGEVRREVRLKMLLSAGIGFAILIVPGVGLWLMLRRYKRIARKAQDVAHMAQMGQVASGLVHEIRNPLNAVLFNLKIMEEGTDHFPEEIREGYAQVIRRAADEVDCLGDLLGEYLSYARPVRWRQEQHDLNAIVEAVLGFLEHECRRHDIKIERDLSPSIPKILVDEKRLKQAVLNVVLNAQQMLRATGGSIRATSYQRDGMVALEIADDGPGVPAEELLKIFEPFYSNREGGTGLGLTIVQRVVEDHGGTIECRSKAGAGAVFVMTLPRYQGSQAGKE